MPNNYVHSFWQVDVEDRDGMEAVALVIHYRCNIPDGENNLLESDIIGTESLKAPDPDMPFADLLSSCDEEGNPDEACFAAAHAQRLGWMPVGWEAEMEARLDAALEAQIERAARNTRSVA